MRKIINRWKQLIIIVAMIFSVVNTNLYTINAANGNASFTWGEEIMYPNWLGNWSTKMCYINGNLAYCLDASKETPPENLNAAYVIENNDALLKVLYYGYGGPGDVFVDDTVSSDKEKYLFTHIMASYAYSGDLYGGNTWEYLTSIGVGLKVRYDQIQSMPVPSNNLYFNGQTNPTFVTYCENGIQRTEDITLNTNESASVYIPLQDGVKLHNVTKGTVNTGIVSVNGGDVFYISAPLKVLEDYSSGPLNGKGLLKYAPLVIRGNATYQSEGSLSKTQDPRTIQLNVNWLKAGSLELTKTNTHKDLIDGAVFNLKSISFDGYNENVTVTDGKINIENLLAGTYKLKEVFAPDGYLLDETEYEITINVGETTTKIIENNEPAGSISLTKEINTDLTDGKIGDTFLQGNKYKLIAREDITNKAGTITYFNKDDVVDTQTTNNEGKLVFDNLHIGKYYIKESKSNETLVLDSKGVNVDIEYEGQNVSKVLRSTSTDNRVNMQKIQIHKSGEKDGISGIVKGLQGAEFTFRLKSEVDRVGWDNAQIYDVIITDENGRANTKYLPYCEYLVRETKTPKDYITAPDFTVSVTKDYSEYADIDQIKIIDINNRPYTTQLKIVKKDLDSNKIVTLNSATFRVKAREDIISNGKVIYKAGETIKQKISGKTYDSFTTSANNVVVPSGSFHIDNDKGTVILPLQLDAGKYFIDEIKTPTGYLSLENSVDFTVENIRDYDKDLNNDPILEIVVKNDKPTGTLEVLKSVELNKEADKSFVDTNDLSKIKFKLTAKENILDMADGSIIYAKDALVGEYNLTKDGKLTVTDLPMGVYELEEISTLDGLVLDKTKHEVKFEQTDLTTKVYTVSQNLVNKPTLVRLIKTDIAGEEELPGALMSVLDKGGNVIDSWISGNKPYLIEGLKVNETYVLKEDLAPLGYVQASEIKFTVEDDNKDQTVKMIDNQVHAVKKDEEGNLLKGAKLQVINNKTKEVIDEWITGKHIFDLTEDMKLLLQKGETISDIYMDENDSSVLYKITPNKDLNDYTLMLQTNNETKYYHIDIEGNETTHLISGLNQNNEYSLIEVEAPDGYATADIQKFTVGSKDISIIMVDEITKVQISKIDITNSQELPGAHLKLEDITTGEAVWIEDWISSDEAHLIKGLLVGHRYRLTEKIAPKGYQVAQAVEFTVENTGDIQRIEMIDELLLPPETGDNMNVDLIAQLYLLASINIIFLGTYIYLKKRNYV